MHAFKPLINIPSSQQATPTQLGSLADYCHQAIIRYAASSEELNSLLDPPAINQVLDALEKHVAGSPWELPDSSASLREFYLHGLYFELNELRASLREQVDGGADYPIGDSIWLAVIGEMRRQLKA